MKKFMIVAVCMIVFGASNLDAMKKADLPDGAGDPTDAVAGAVAEAARNQELEKLTADAEDLIALLGLAEIRSPKDPMGTIVSLTKKMREAGCAAAQEAAEKAAEQGMNSNAASNFIVVAGRTAVGGKLGGTYMQVRSKLPAEIIARIKANDQMAEKHYFDGFTDDGSNKQFDTIEEVLGAVVGFANLLVSQAEALAAELETA